MIDQEPAIYETKARCRHFRSLGEPHEYRSWFSDQVGLVLLARSPAQVGGDLRCRPEGDIGDYKQIFHTHSEVMQVLSDFDAAELKSRM
jgi:hypothetical protein